MKKLIYSLLAIAFACNGCKKTVDEGYWKVSFTAAIHVYNDGSIDESGGGPIACFSDGYIGAVLYFPVHGGDLVAQNSFVTVDSVSCIHCISQMMSQSANIPIELAATLDLTSVSFGDANGTVTAVVDDFRIWMPQPLIYPIDLYYDCGPQPGVASDYGNAVSQLCSPFLTQVWSFSPSFDLVHQSNYNGYAFPPSYKADISFQMYEEYVKTIPD